jgi:F-type H+-transporting ATPase subunit delta
MADSKVAKRYAKSLFDLATERNITSKINDDMMLVDATCKQSRDFDNLLKSPIVKPDKKDAVIGEVFGSKIDALSLAFFKIIVHKGRERYIPEIASEFIHLFKVSKGVVTAYITTAVQMDAALRAEVMQLVNKLKNQEIELIETVDPNMIGGFKIRVGDRQIDSTVSTTLRRLKGEFNDNLYVKAI